MPPFDRPPCQPGDLFYFFALFAPVRHSFRVLRIESERAKFIIEVSHTRAVSGGIRANPRREPLGGIDGAFVYGAGTESIRGLSEESRFVLNPFLLVGLVEPCAFILGEMPDWKEHPWPKPEKLSWRGTTKTLEVTYRVGRKRSQTLRREFSSSPGSLSWLGAR